MGKKKGEKKKERGRRGGRPRRGHGLARRVPLYLDISCKKKRKKKGKGGGGEGGKGGKSTRPAPSNQRARFPSLPPLLEKKEEKQGDGRTEEIPQAVRLAGNGDPKKKKKEKKEKGKRETRGSSHPVARALLRHLRFLDFEDVEERTGGGGRERKKGRKRASPRRDRSRV